MKTIYEVECQRNNVTPKEFFRYCKIKCKKQDLDIESWIEFDSWEEPTPLQRTEYHTNEHFDWEKPQRETIKIMPYDWQMALQNSYNFILEFEFDTETKGHGYFYVVETR